MTDKMPETVAETVPMTTIAMDFQGAHCVATCEDPAWTAHFRSAFGHLVLDDPTPRPDSFRIDLARLPQDAARPAASDWPVVFEGMLPDGLHATIHQSGDDLLFQFHDGSHVTIWQQNQRAEAKIQGDFAATFFGTALMTVIDAALFATDQQMVHAAGLTDPVSGKGLLFFVPSGGGKTTTSLALARGGFGLMTDDASVVQETEKGFRIWGLPRALKVHHQTAAMLPWLTPPTDIWDENGEQAIPLDLLETAIALTDPAPVPLGAIVIIGARRPEGHRVSRATRAEALVALAHDNVGVRKGGGMAPKAIANYQRLARLVQTAPILMLNAGTDLASLPQVLAEGLANLNESTPAAAAAKGA